jgi:hypothetical protein
MNPTLHALLVVGGAILAIVALIAIIAFFGDRLAKRSVARRIEKLRATGVIPAADKASDSDVIRLANECRREEAALLYVSLHKSNLGKARVVVGSTETQKRLIFIVVALLFCIALLQLAKSGGNPGVVVIWIATFFIFLAAWLRTRKLVAKNRAILESGALPPLDGDAWKKER